MFMQYLLLRSISDKSHVFADSHHILLSGLMVVTGSESPIVVVLSGSMEPAFKVNKQNPKNYIEKI